MCYNCVDRHVKEGNGDRVAFFWEGNDVDQASTTTYKQLQDMVCQVRGAGCETCTCTRGGRVGRARGTASRVAWGIAWPPWLDSRLPAQPASPS